MSELSQQYYARREAQERDQAARAATRETRTVHLELAERYLALRGETRNIVAS